MVLRRALWLAQFDDFDGSEEFKSDAQRLLEAEVRGLGALSEVLVTETHRVALVLVTVVSKGILAWHRRSNWLKAMR